MDKHKIVSSNDEINEKEKIVIGLSHLFFLFLILIQVIELFVTYEKIFRKRKEFEEFNKILLKMKIQ